MSGEAKSGNLPKWVIVAIALLAVVIYAPTYNGEFLLDDFDALVENQSVTKGWSGIPEIWTQEYRAGFADEGGSLYRPLTQTVFAMLWSAFPQNPVPFHLLNMLLYALSALILLRWLQRLFPKEHWWLWAFIALLFVVHPIHTEVVSNIKSLDEILSVLFVLLMLLALDRWANSNSKSDLFQMLLWWMLALCSKEGVISMLAFLPLLLIHKYQRSIPQAAKATAIMLVPVLAYLGLRWVAIGGLTGGEEIPMLDNVVVGASGLERITTPVTLLGYYVWKLLAPWSLSHDYSFRQLEPMGIDHLGFWASLVTWCAIVYWITYFRRKHLGIWLALMLFAITIALYSNLVLIIGTHFAERLMYLPSLGMAMLLGWLFYLWALRSNPLKEWGKARWSLSALLVFSFLMAGKSMDRARLWKDGKRLFEADVATAPMSTRTHYRLGRYYNKLGLAASNENEKQQWHKEALTALKLSVQIYPEFADAHGELALAYQNLGQLELALTHNNKALEINPGHASALNNKGAVLFLQDQFEDAIPYFEAALQIRPNFRDAAGNLGSCHGRLGAYEQALKWFLRAIEIDPNYAQNYYFVAMTYNNLGDKEKTDKWLNRAQEVERTNLGN